MSVFNTIANFLRWLIEHLSVSIGKYSFSLLGAILFAGIICIFICVIRDILGK